MNNWYRRLPVNGQNQGKIAAQWKFALAGNRSRISLAGGENSTTETPLLQARLKAVYFSQNLSLVKQEQVHKVQVVPNGVFKKPLPESLEASDQWTTTQTFCIGFKLTVPLSTIHKHIVGCYTVQTSLCYAIAAEFRAKEIALSCGPPNLEGIISL